MKCKVLGLLNWIYSFLLFLIIHTICSRTLCSRSKQWTGFTQAGRFSTGSTAPVHGARVLAHFDMLSVSCCGSLLAVRLSMLHIEDELFCDIAQYSHWTLNAPWISFHTCVSFDSKNDFVLLLFVDLFRFPWCHAFHWKGALCHAFHAQSFQSNNFHALTFYIVLLAARFCCESADGEKMKYAHCTSTGMYFSLSWRPQRFRKICWIVGVLHLLHSVQRSLFKCGKYSRLKSSKCLLQIAFCVRNVCVQICFAVNGSRNVWQQLFQLFDLAYLSSDNSNWVPHAPDMLKYANNLTQSFH